MKLLLASILLAGSAYCAEPTIDLEDSIEFVHSESGLYKKIYINSDDVQISESKLLLKRANHSLPINSLHSDARGLEPVVEFFNLRDSLFSD